MTKETLALLRTAKSMPKEQNSEVADKIYNERRELARMIFSPGRKNIKKES